MRVNILLAIAVFITGCATGGANVADPNFMKDFGAGNVRLTCTLACAGSAGANRSKLTQLYTQGKWPDLAREVARIGYENEREYFYLGVAAQQLGYKNAARTYYNLALTTQYKCSIQGCDGFVFPRDIQSQLSLLDAPVTNAKKNSNKGSGSGVQPNSSVAPKVVNQQQSSQNFAVTQTKPLAVSSYIDNSSQGAFIGSCTAILNQAISSRDALSNQETRQMFVYYFGKYGDMLKAYSSGNPQLVIDSARARDRTIQAIFQINNDADYKTSMRDAATCIKAVRN